MTLKKFLLILFALIAFPARAAIMELPVPQDLIAFVAQKTGISLPTEQKIEVVDNDNAIFKSAAAQHEGASAAEQAGVIYLPVRSAVHLQEPQIQALIVHELTHVAQEKSGKKYACIGAKEAEAYENQIAYLKEQGQIPYRPSAEEIQAMANCKTDF